MFSKKKIFIIPLALAFCMVVGLSFASASSQIEGLFTEMKDYLQKPGNIDDSTVIATVGDENITVKELRQHKANLKFMMQFQNKEINKSNSEQVKDMVKRLLTIQYAKKHGVTVSDEELQNYIQQHRENLDKLSKEAQKVQDHLIEKTGLTAEQYWKDEDTLEMYRNWLLINKLISQLQSEGEIEDSKDFVEFQEKLLNNNENKITTKQDVIKKVR